MGGWFLLVLFLHGACASRLPSLAPLPVPRAPIPLTPEPGLEGASVYAVDFLEPGAVSTRPVPIAKAEFQPAVQRLFVDVRLGRTSPKQAARELLRLLPPPEAETVESKGKWRLETHHGRVLTLVPVEQDGPVRLTPEADEKLKGRYLQWCTGQGGGDCLGLLDDGPYLGPEDRRAFALALAFGSVLDETRQALTRELLDVRAIISMVVWTVALYCMLWLVPEPTTKLVAASLTALLMAYLGLKTVYDLMDGWALMADTAYHATTYEEVHAAGAKFGRVLGQEAARAMILAVAALTGHTLGQVAARVKSLPGFHLAQAQWKAQGGAAALAPELATETALAQEPALARAVAAVDTIATSPQGPLAVVMLKKGPGSGAEMAPGGRSSETVVRHRGGNRQVQLDDGQRWHLPRGMSAKDIPAEDTVGDMLQEAVTKAAKEWGPKEFSRNERSAIDEALKKGEYWLARLLEREARGRFVHARVKKQFEGRLQFNHKGVDVIEPKTGRQYEILAGTDSNLARHGRRMAGEFFRMLTF
ncbi:hypothetical protein [Archangium sp.]|uniref:SitA5 family polymorphic toxin n=1 Tax=Archangium sp. TaxID=1872627 RepID=UPI00286BBC39|nr:hypothetical protein [Archangium sp.]